MRLCVQVKDDGKAPEAFNLADYERSEELRKAKSRSKKNHSRFIVLRCKRPGNAVSLVAVLITSSHHHFILATFARRRAGSARASGVFCAGDISVLIGGFPPASASGLVD